MQHRTNHQNPANVAQANNKTWNSKDGTRLTYQLHEVWTRNGNEEYKKYYMDISICSRGREGYWLLGWLV